MDNLSNRIKELRTKNNMSQFDLGEKLFVSDKTISSWESNRTTPNIDMIFKICDIFNTNLYSLISHNKETIETEIKLKVNENEYNRILNLIKSNSKFINEENQSATYYNPYNVDMKDKWLRIRSEGNKTILNLKIDNDFKYCEEYEVSIDNEINLKQIFKYLNFKKIAVVNKTRNKYLYKDKYEFSFDNVDDLGTFVEIEVKKYDLTPLEEYNNLIKLLYELNIDINLIDNKRYPEYFLEKGEIK